MILYCVVQTNISNRGNSIDVAGAFTTVREANEMADRKNMLYNNPIDFPNIYRGEYYEVLVTTFYPTIDIKADPLIPIVRV